MKLIAPDYYGDFKCIAGACRHSCCVGWEIDIDPESEARYAALPGEFGKRVRASMEHGENGAFFRMDADERCPFLNVSGLCDMILELGEDSLCQICADHPRFRNFFTDREYIGLGLCCEAAGRLILGRQTPSKLEILEDDGGKECLSDDEMELLEMMDDVAAFFRESSLPMLERVAGMLTELGMPARLDYTSWAEFLSRLERLDDSWKDELDALKCGREKQDMHPWEQPFERLMEYLLYRHLPAALDDGCVDERIAFCCVMWLIVRRMCAVKDEMSFEHIVEVCRLFSSEIEYSDENIERIIEYMTA